jgi:ribokinase
MSVLVVGSVNMDLVARAANVPAPGETLLGRDFALHHGGKGANQAVAVGRLGGDPYFLCRVGQDTFGSALLEGLKKAGVRTDFCSVDPTSPSGVALITVADDGQNSIVVAPGANWALTPADVELVLDRINPTVVLAQLEIRLETVEALVARLRPGTKFILNPAPARPLPDSLLSRVDVITPNESEASFLTGVTPKDDDSCGECAKLLLDKGVKAVVITMGSLGCWIQGAGFAGRIPAPVVKAIDTTAAGDAFNGALADALSYSDSMPLEDACRAASIVASLSVTRSGAQESMPTMQEVHAFAAALLSAQE